MSRKEALKRDQKSAYDKIKKANKMLTFLVAGAGFEPTTFGL